MECGRSHFGSLVPPVLHCCAPIMAFHGMEWHCDTCRERFLQDWENQAKAMDPVGYGACRGVHEWMFQRMVIMCRDPPRHFGTIGWAWNNAIHSGEWIGGYAWSDGRSCESQNAPLAVNELGCRWWPCIVAIDSNDKIPFYCPALACHKSRPWTIHRTRVHIEPSARKGLCPVRAISATSATHNEEGARSGSILAIEDISATSAATAHNEEAPRSGSTPEPEAEPEMDPDILQTDSDCGETEVRRDVMRSLGY